MRIIAGEHRGRRLEAPKGRTTRPTTDRVRESLMSALASARGGFEGAVVLDAFAGSGALALEALSRGAHAACLCDCDKQALAAMRANAATLGYGRDRARICRLDVLEGRPPRLGAPYDLVFLDPPYATEPAAVLALVARLDAGLLAEDVVIAYEHDGVDDARVDEQLAASAFALASRKRYGDTVIDLLERSAEREEERAHS